MPPDAHQPAPAQAADTPPKPPEIDRDTLHTFLNTLAEHGLETLLHSGAVPSPDAAVYARDNCAVLVAVFPLPGNAEGAVGLTDCQRRCLSILTQAVEPLSAARVRLEMKRQAVAAKRPSSRFYGIVTVKNALKKLKDMGLVSNSRRSRRGFYLPERLPLFRYAASNKT
jgi:hypothetical protein